VVSRTSKSPCFFERAAKRGSALVMAIWIIAVLSIMVVSFAFEARQQAGINVYVRERNRVLRLIEPGRILAEIVLLNFQDAKEWSEGENVDELDEEDRFYKEKRDLKFDKRCVIGPILMDENDHDSGVVTVEIELVNSGDGGININQLFSSGDQQYALRWQMILRNAGIPEDFEVEVTDADGRGTTKRNLMNHLIACWNDWRDEDDVVSQGPISDMNPLEDDGAESAWYKEYYEEQEKSYNGKERDIAKEDRRMPRNGSIPDVKELDYIRGFRDFPAVLTGGLLMPDEEESEDNPRLKGIASLFGTRGTSKITITPKTTIDQLMTIPGIFPEDIDDFEESRIFAQAIIDGLKIMPEEDANIDETREWWPYKDWDDLCTRVEDIAETDIKPDQQTSQYIQWDVTVEDEFKVKITAECMGVKHEATCVCYVKDKAVRYTEWREK
jgi:hypothetical protein